LESISRAKLIPCSTNPLTRKDNSSRCMCKRLRLLSCYHFVNRSLLAMSKRRNFNLLPFRLRGQCRDINPLSYSIRMWLRADSLLSKCCLQETICHFGPQDSNLSIRYYYQDLHYWRLQCGSRQHLPRHQHACLLAEAYTSLDTCFSTNP
jgi:hypothetical protein